MSTELSTTSILSLFDTNKDQRQSFCIDLISRIENGEIDPLKAHYQVKSMEDIIKQLNDNTVYKRSLLSAAETYGQKSFEFGKAKFEIKEVGVKYDFSQCSDPVLAELEAKASEVSEKLKARQSFLKTVPLSGVTVVIEETGETATVYPPAKSSTTSVSVTLK